MSASSKAQQKQLLPFQQQNVASNQQGVPLSYLGGVRLVAVKWITPAFGKITQTVPGAGKKG